jgi:hypothetical protein
MPNISSAEGAQVTFLGVRIVQVQEETCTDDETGHLGETVNYLAFEHGTAHKIRGLNVAPPHAVPSGKSEDCVRAAEVDDGHCIGCDSGLC